MGTSDREDIPDVPPPSYDDALNQNNFNLAPPPPNRPQILGSGHSSSNSTFQSFGTSTSSTSRPAVQRPPNSLSSNINDQGLYSNGNLPFSYPKGHLCSKCKNTGYKTKSGEMCTKCWKSFYLNKHSYNPNSELPFKYPRGFLCEKCENSGTKRKNGKTCKDCWLRFAPRQGGPGISHTLYPLYPLFSPFFGGASTITQVGGPGTARAVPPGDPRIGGTLCGRCRGSGITHFLLDEELCPVCHGLGRVVPAQPQWVPQVAPMGPPGPSMGYPPQGPPQGYNQGYQGPQGPQVPQPYNQGNSKQNYPYKN